MHISDAVQAMKEGKQVTRTEGWHGKHFLIYVDAQGDDVRIDDSGFVHNDGNDHPKLRHLRPFVGIVPANDPTGVTPWLCSQADLLAEDWEIVGEEETVESVA